MGRPNGLIIVWFSYEGATDLGPLGTFLFDGLVGKGLVNHVRGTVEKSQCDIQASQIAGQAEAYGQVIQMLDWNPFYRSAARPEEIVSWLDDHVAVLENFLIGLEQGNNPVFNPQCRKKEKRFHLTDVHNAILARVNQASERAWTHLMRCVLKYFEENARRSIRIAAHALENNGEVEFEHDNTGVLGEAGSAQVCLFRFELLTLAIDSTLLQHGCFSTRQADKEKQPATWLKPWWDEFRELVLEVDLLSKNIVSVAECALVSNGPRLQALYPELRWGTADIKDMLLVPQKLDSFVRSRN